MSQMESLVAFAALASAIVGIPTLVGRFGRQKKKVDPSANYIECPASHDGSGITIFLAGGISGTTDWQQLMKQRLQRDCPNLVLYNPRRKDFDVNDPNATPFQIAWEHDHLRKSKAVLFWFPPETLCPITLYELGTWTQISLTTDVKIFVGCDPNYKRLEDVKIQTKLASDAIPPVVTSLDALADLVVAWYRSRQ